MKRWGLLCVGILLFAGIASAQDTPKVEVFGGYSFLHTSVPASVATNGFSSNGASGSAAFNFNNWLGVVGDFGFYESGKKGINGTLISYMGGPKFAYRGNDKVTIFAQTLFGGMHATPGKGANSFAMALGGGADYNLSEHLGIRIVQAEYLLTRFNLGVNPKSQNNVRISAGVVFRF